MLILKIVALFASVVAIAEAACPAGSCKTSATPYCSSYLSIPKSTATVQRTSTITATITSTSVTSTQTVTSGKASTSTVIVTVQPITTTTSKSIVTVSTDTTTTVRPTCELPIMIMAIPNRQKRQASPKPACFSTFTNNRAISSACSCLSIKPTTTTVTSTIRSTATITSVKRTITTKTLAPPPTTITSTTTGSKTSIITSKTTITTTSYTTTITTTSGSVAIPSSFVIMELDNGAYGSTSNNNTINFSSSSPSTYRLDSSGNLYSGSSKAYISNNDPGQITFGSGASSLQCSISVTEDNTCPMNCVGPMGDTQTTCGTSNGYYVGSGQGLDSEDDGSGCGEVDLVVLDPPK